MINIEKNRKINNIEEYYQVFEIMKNKVENLRELSDDLTHLCNCAGISNNDKYTNILYQIKDMNNLKCSIICHSNENDGSIDYIDESDKTREYLIQMGELEHDIYKELNSIDLSDVEYNSDSDSEIKENDIEPIKIHERMKELINQMIDINTPRLTNAELNLHYIKPYKNQCNPLKTYLHDYIDLIDDDN